MSNKPPAGGEQLLLDAGAAVERTAMAWSRTALAVLATSALASRLVAGDGRVLPLVLIVLGVLGSGVLHLFAQRRYRRLQSRLAGAPGTGVPEALWAGRLVAVAVLVLSALAATSVLAATGP